MLNNNHKQVSSFSAALHFPYCIHIFPQSTGVIPVFTLEGPLCNLCTRVGTLIVGTIYLQLIQNRYMFRSFTVLHCSHLHCVQPIASDVEVVGYL